MSLRALRDYIIVERVVDKVSAGGIHLVDSLDARTSFGKVISVGEFTTSGGEKIPIDVKPGDTVVCARVNGAMFKVDGRELWCLGQEHVFAVVEN